MTETPILKVRRLHPDARLPERSTPGSAGLDLFAWDGGLDLSNPTYYLDPGGRILVRTGIALEIPDGFEGQIRPRSGLALRNGITVLNTPGTIDSDYRGEVGVILVNLSNQYYFVNHGDRIAQLVIAPVTRAEVVEVDELSDTTRGEGGFGSTGR
jgi:dUTP pyrophosphatase